MAYLCYLQHLNEVLLYINYINVFQLSWGDFYLASVMDSLSGMLGMDVTEKYPNISNLQKKIFSMPKVKEYIAKRPKSDF